MKQPSITSKKLVAENPRVFSNVSTRMKQHRLPTTLSPLCHIAAQKPLQMSAMIKKRIDFCNKYMLWTEEEQEGMVSSDESCFYVIMIAGKMVKHAHGSNCFSPKYTIKMVKHAAYTIIWICCSGRGGSGGLVLLPRNTTMNRERKIL